MGQPGYIGVKTCKMCHKGEKKGNVFEIWSESKHANSSQALVEKGEQNNPDCLICHTTGFGKGGFNPEAGELKLETVECEACHGPGSDYKKMTVMKDSEAAKTAGLRMPDEEFCKTCHNPNSPNFEEFDFAKAWAEIKHEIPE
ncbi:cytochrome C554 [bacterium]|nr:cytochrome C554 [bacterium]